MILATTVVFALRCEAWTRSITVPLLLILRLFFFFRIQEVTLWSVSRNAALPL
jgi:hypothetical protein